MSKRDIKDRIRSAYAEETPEIRERIQESCKREVQALQLTEEKKKKAFFEGGVTFKRVLACAMCLLLFISGFSVGFFLPETEDAVTPQADTFVYLDVNPSIELRMDKDNRIVECNPLNEDAMIVLADLDLSGVEMNTALTAIIGSMYVNGYLTTESNSILVSVDSADNSRTQGLLSDITNRINRIFDSSEMECSIIAQSLSVNDDLKQKAETNGVSVGKMYLVEKMVTGMTAFEDEDEDELSDMSIGELGLIYSNHSDRKEHHDFDDDIVSGKVNGYVERADALSVLIKELGISEDDIDEYEIKAEFIRGEERQMIYTVILELKGDENEYRYTVDCRSGKVLSNLPSHENNEGDSPSPPDVSGGEHHEID